MQWTETTTIDFFQTASWLRQKASGKRHSCQMPPPNYNARQVAFNAKARFQPFCQFADEENKKINHFDDFAAIFLVLAL